MTGVSVQAPISDPETVLSDNPAPKHLDWGEKFVVFSLASAIALSSVQIDFQKLSLVFYFLGLAMLLAFSCFLISRSVHSYCPRIARAVEHFSIFFGVTAFFISITIPFPALWFKCVAWSVYAASWIAILICNSHHILLMKNRLAAWYRSSITQCHIASEKPYLTLTV